MKENQVIDKTMISFSIDLDSQSYAYFGGVDPSHVKGGEKSIKYFRKYEDKDSTWSLEGQGFLYGKKPHLLETSVNAIIDTGSS